MVCFTSHGGIVEMGTIAVQVFKDQFSEEEFNRLEKLYLDSDSSHDDVKGQDAEEDEAADHVKGIANELKKVDIVADDWGDLASDSDWMIDGCAEAKTRNGIIIVWNRIFVSCEVCIIYHLPHTEYTSICHNGCWIPNTFLSKFIWKVLDAQSKSVLEHLVMNKFW